MTTNENIKLTSAHKGSGIYLFEMTATENVKADGFDYVDGIYLFEMTTIENQDSLRWNRS